MGNVCKSNITNTIENAEACNKLVSACPTRLILFILFRTLYGSKKSAGMITTGRKYSFKNIQSIGEKVDNKMFQ